MGAAENETFSEESVKGDGKKIFSTFAAFHQIFTDVLSDHCIHLKHRSQGYSPVPLPPHYHQLVPQSHSGASTGHLDH